MEDVPRWVRIMRMAAEKEQEAAKLRDIASNLVRCDQVHKTERWRCAEDQYPEHVHRYVDPQSLSMS